MTIERLPYTGAWQITATVNDRLVTRTYYFYTRDEAATLFCQEFNIEPSKDDEPPKDD